MPAAKSQTLSIGLHVAVLALLLLFTTRSIQNPPAVPDLRPIVRLAPLRRLLLHQPEQRSGGSNRTALPARHGQPPPTARRTFIPPRSLPEPKLPMPITVAFESPTIQIDAAEIGDPLSRLRNGALGTKDEGGIGNVKGPRGIGDDLDGRAGITRGRPGHPLTPAELIYKEEPEFSEQARKAKYQGVVVLTIEVDTNGRPRGLRVIRPLGLGLDEKAIEAVSKWRFRPGSQDGKPVVTTATVEVTFRLL